MIDKRNIYHSILTLICFRFLVLKADLTNVMSGSSIDAILDN